MILPIIREGRLTDEDDSINREDKTASSEMPSLNNRHSAKTVHDEMSPILTLYRQSLDQKYLEEEKSKQID